MQLSALVVSALLAMVQDKTVDNPQFNYWSKWKPGAWMKFAADMEQAGQKMNMETTMKLLEVGTDKVVIETTGKVKFSGQEVNTPAQKQEIKAKEAADKVKIEKEGDEEVEVNGKKLKCHWIQVIQEQAGKKMTAKIWLAKEIPGGMAKSEMTMDGADKPMMKMLAIEWGEK